MNTERTNDFASAETEPTATATAVPIWLIALLLVLLFLGLWTFDLHGGGFEPKVYAPYRSIAHVDGFQPGKNASDPLRGKPIFEQACALCHKSDGQGKPNQAPPLAGSDWVNAKGVNRLIRIPLLGVSPEPIEVSGKTYTFSSAMTPFGSSLSDDQIAAVLTYIRQAWGNKAGPVTEEQVKAVRAKLGNRTQPTSPSELKSVPEE